MEGNSLLRSVWLYMRHLQSRSSARCRNLECTLPINTVVIHNHCKRFKGPWFGSHQRHFWDSNYSG